MLQLRSLYTVCLFGFVLGIFVLVMTNTIAYFNGPLWRTADSAQLISVQMKETPLPFG